ncbi:unnamed protein product (macronuclear) [Paramecium tetraurelia]|uniref:Uncharacterized protein n=1 Tax=Paramecium tetraurelia TaxID=5888 RepID=A0CAM2_PARTE|nr:uncharacterized protein GSPATT00036620001 [Paramecium tetraurelia]CAK67839.1 unnamed protein product [Paramecium tetraurelia]|eukprot:XP_001435236.1 hypothetical protein (macronuclear) [Paramecium tetraurelia strain d4-2]
MNNNNNRYYSDDPNQQLQYNQQTPNQQDPFNQNSKQPQQLAYQIGNVNHAAFNNPMAVNDSECSGLVSSADSDIRAGFIVKVYAIMSFQLSITFLLILASYYFQNVRNAIINTSTIQYTPLTIFCFVIALVIEVAIFCCRKVARKVPLNYILLTIFTLCFSTVVAAPCIICFELLSNGVQLVIIAASITVAITIMLTIYAWRTKTDYSAAGHFCFVLSMSVLIMCIIGLFVRNIWFHLFICTLCIIIYGGYIIFDTQLIIGNHSNYLTIDDYIIAAMLLYVDIVILFLRILEILMIIFGKT